MWVRPVRCDIIVVSAGRRWRKFGFLGRHFESGVAPFGRGRRREEGDGEAGSFAILIDIPRKELTGVGNVTDRYLLCLGYLDLQARP